MTGENKSPQPHSLFFYGALAAGAIGILAVAAAIVVLVLKRRPKKKYRTRRKNENSKIININQQKTWYSREQMKPVHRQMPLAVMSETQHRFTIPRAQDKTKTSNKESETTNLSVKEGARGMTKWHSEEHLPPMRSLLETGRSGSCLTINDADSLDSDKDSDSIFKFVPSVDMSLVWASSSSSLSITISKISNLPPKLTKSHISATIRLVPRQSSFDQETVPFSPPTTPMKPPSSLHGMECPSGSSTPRGSFSMPRGHRFSISSLSSPDLNQSTSKYKIRKTLDDNFSQIFTFADLNYEDVKESEIHLDLKTKKRGILGTRPFGEVTYNLAESEFLPDRPIVVTLRLSSKRKNSFVFSSSNLLLGATKAGTLSASAIQILLKYQITGMSTGRVKCVILRAKALDSQKSGGQYRIDIVVRIEGDVVKLFKTASVNAVASPVWNSSLLFDVEQKKSKEMTLEATLVRIGRTRRTTTMGRVFVGFETTESGQSHWQQVLDKTNREITVWHPLI